MCGILVAKMSRAENARCLAENWERTEVKGVHIGKSILVPQKDPDILVHRIRELSSALPSFCLS